MKSRFPGFSTGYVEFLSFHVTAVFRIAECYAVLQDVSAVWQFVPVGYVVCIELGVRVTAHFAFVLVSFKYTFSKVSAYVLLSHN